MIAQPGNLGIDPRIEKAVDTAYRRVETMYVQYNMAGDDWPHIYKESPRIIARINEIEDSLSGSTPIEEVYMLVDAWVKNYEQVFRRRAYLKQNQLAG